MPWKDPTVMDLRVEFALRAVRGSEPFGALCDEYGISRKTGYKWKERFLANGITGLQDVSRKPHHSPNELSEDVVCEIVRFKSKHKLWGPTKIRGLYARNHPTVPIPSESSFKRILEKCGFVEERKKRRNNTCGRIENRFTPDEPNDLWTVDFKGWWYTCDQQRCEPLTVRDEYSRYILCAVPLENATSKNVRKQFEQLFEHYGMPKCIRSDNGSPFACTRAPLGLSRLSAWWVALGITLDRIPPGRPDQNGGHERMHRDLAAEVQSRPAASLQEQIACLETWRIEFNLERPHQALHMRVPGDVYAKSARCYIAEPIEIEYPSECIVRKVNAAGQIKLDGACIPISTAIAGWHIGLKADGESLFVVWFGSLCIGTIDLKTISFEAADA